MADGSGGSGGGGSTSSSSSGTHGTGGKDDVAQPGDAAALKGKAPDNGLLSGGGDGVITIVGVLMAMAMFVGAFKLGMPDGGTSPGMGMNFGNIMGALGLGGDKGPAVASNGALSGPASAASALTAPTAATPAAHAPPAPSMPGKPA